MNNFLKIAAGVNTLPLMLAIQRRPQLWKEDSFLRHYPQGPFGEVESIMLRFPEKVVFDPKDRQAKKKLALYKENKLPGFDQHESIDYPAYAVLPEARVIVMSIFAGVAGERLGRVMINKIKPGGRIFPHADTPEHVRYYSRYHVVLQSKPGVRFLCGGEETYMACGEAWWFRNADIHEVINETDEDRIHLVMDAHCSA